MVFLVCVIDYGAGNLQSVVKALAFIGQKAQVTADPAQVLAADRLIFPGVGAFGDAMNQLKSRGLDTAIAEYINADKPFLGICLGLQLLFQTSEESPGIAGLGILQGSIRRFPKIKGIKVPHIGWNSLEITQNVAGAKLFAGLPNGAYMYFVHSYCLQSWDEVPVSAVCGYGVPFGAAVCRGNLHAVQFHPEKSGGAGIRLLQNFLEG